MNNQDKQNLVQSLNQLLADTAVFKQKAQAYHWNVTGLLFGELHEQFGEIYEGLEEPFDDIAEQIRILGERPEVSLSGYAEGSFLEEPELPPPSTAEMLQNLYEDNERIIAVLKEIERISNEAEGENGAAAEDVLDFAVERHRQHDMYRFKLRSYIDDY